MKKKPLLILCFVVVCLFLNGCQSRKAVSSTAVSQCQTLRQKPDHSVQNVLIGGRSMSLEVVNSPASIQQGLSGRSAVGSDGMLFIMPGSDTQTFWMKDMLFDLDLLWIQDCRIVAVTPNVPKPVPNTPTSQLLTYSSNQPVDMVLEVPVGLTAKLFSDPIGLYLSL